MKPRYVRAGNVIDEVREIAREHGYALGVHGSMRENRDIDLIAVPWTRKARACSSLVKAVGELPYLLRRVDGEFARSIRRAWGRQGFVFYVRFRHGTCPAYVDLSVMPRG